MWPIKVRFLYLIQCIRNKVTYPMEEKCGKKKKEYNEKKKKKKIKKKKKKNEASTRFGSCYNIIKALKWVRLV